MTRDLSALVTILLPVRDGAATLERALRNLLAVSDGAQLLVVDDGSTDGSADIARAHAPAARTISAPGRGLAYALNVGLGSVTTPYLARADVDDLSVAHRFTRQVRLLEARPDLAACATGVRERRAGLPDRIILPPKEPADLARALMRSNPIAHGSVLARTASLRAVGGYDERFRYAQDYDLWLRLLDVGGIGCVPDVLYVRYAPTGAEFRRKRRRQAAAAAHAQLRHLRRTRRISAGSFTRNCLSACWIGPRRSP